MKTRALLAGLLIATVGMSGLAQANPGNGNPAHGDSGHGNDSGKGHDGSWPANHQQRGHDARDDHRDWHEGGKVPQRYRDDSHWVQDWHDHDLPEPPRGHRWLNIDGDYVLAAVATGVITSIILGH